MFPKPPSPIFRPRRSIRRLYLPLIVVVVLAVCQLHESFSVWPTGSNELVHRRQEVFPPRPKEDQKLQLSLIANALRKEDDDIHLFLSSDNAGSGPALEVPPSEPISRPHKSGRYDQSRIEVFNGDSSGSEDVVDLATQSEQGDLVLDHAIERPPSSHRNLPASASEHLNRKNSVDSHGTEEIARHSKPDSGEKQEGWGVTVQDEDELQSPIQVLREMSAWSEHYRFPSRADCNEVREKANTLPDMVFVPFEDAVADMELMGWEDLWVSKARYAGPKLSEPKIDFLYNWVNGSQSKLVATMRPYETESTLNDEQGVWIASHGSNRYREWNELRYSMRSIEKYAGTFANRVQILVNAFEERSQNGTQVIRMGKQRPDWLRDDTREFPVQVLSQEQFFGPEERKCLPSFDSLTIENQLYNTKSETDRLFALSDDMILGKPHAASDLYSPLFGPTLGFKDNAYNTLQPPTSKDAERFGEKPFLIYTSWLLNRRFGARKRKGQVHFGHSLSRSITREAITSFPRPALLSATQRFRGETGFQLYSWYLVFHYTMERHREALLWSYIMLRSDTDDDGYLSWSERQKILRDISEGMSNESPDLFRHRMYYRLGDNLEQAGLERPKVNTDIIWTSLDGPYYIKDLDCDAFDTEDCLAPGFSFAASDSRTRSPMFSSATIFHRVTREAPRCGDCLLKLVLNRRRAGLGTLLPHPTKKPQQRAIVVKALMKYQYTIVQPDASFYMITDAEQVEHVLIKPYIKHNKKIGQLCLNDDFNQDEQELEALRKAMSKLFEGLLPEKSSFEK